MLLLKHDAKWGAMQLFAYEFLVSWFLKAHGPNCIVAGLNRISKRLNGIVMLSDEIFHAGDIVQREPALKRQSPLTDIDHKLLGNISVVPAFIEGLGVAFHIFDMAKLKTARRFFEKSSNID